MYSIEVPDKLNKTFEVKWKNYNYACFFILKFSLDFEENGGQNCFSLLTHPKYVDLENVPTPGNAAD